MSALYLTTVRDFLYFHTAVGRGKFKYGNRIAANSLNTNTKWFFAVFSCVTGTTVGKHNGTLGTLGMIIEMDWRRPSLAGKECGGGRVEQSSLGEFEGVDTRYWS